jgi:hypothetical protein
MMMELAQWYGQGKIKPVIDRTMPELDKAVADYKLDEYYERALDLVISGRAREAFALDREPAKLRDTYGRDTFGQSLLLARRLVEAGTRVVEVVWPKFANSDNHSWDHHVGLDKRMKNQSAPMLDRGLSAFIADMDERGLLEDTLVVAGGTDVVPNHKHRLHEPRRVLHIGRVDDVAILDGVEAGEQLPGRNDDVLRVAGDKVIQPDDFVAVSQKFIA